LARLVRGMTSSPSTRETVKSSLSLAASAESRPPGGEYAKHRTPLSGYLHLWPTEKEIFNVQLCKIKDYKNEIPVLLLPYLFDNIICSMAKKYTGTVGSRSGRSRNYWPPGCGSVIQDSDPRIRVLKKYLRLVTKKLVRVKSFIRIF
jgi:hypothetical protein